MAEPVLSYPGAKWKFYNDMVKYFPEDMKDFREPFFGGGSVSLSVADDPRFKKLERIQVGDLASEIWAFWTGARDYPDEVIELCNKWYKEKLPHHPEMRELGIEFMKDYIEKGKDYTKDIHISPSQYGEIQEGIELCRVAIQEGQAFWDWADKVDTKNMSIPERAARTYLVNKFSFSGMGDSGSLSKERFFAYTPDMTIRITKASPLLKRMEIRNCSFEETMDNVDRNNSFIFLDPPYYRQEKSGLYGRHGDTHHGFPHDHFAEFTKQTDCKWFVTYDDSPKVRKMFRGKPVFEHNGKKKIYMVTYRTVYTMAKQAAEDALAGEELFIANYDIEGQSASFDELGI